MPLDGIEHGGVAFLAHGMGLEPASMGAVEGKFPCIPGAVHFPEDFGLLHRVQKEESFRAIVVDGKDKGISFACMEINPFCEGFDIHHGIVWLDRHGPDAVAWGSPFLFFVGARFSVDPIWYGFPGRLPSLISGRRGSPGAKIMQAWTRWTLVFGPVLVGTAYKALGFIVRLILPSACTIFESWKGICPRSQKRLWKNNAFHGNFFGVEWVRCKALSSRLEKQCKPSVWQACLNFDYNENGGVSAISEQVRPWLATCTVFAGVQPVFGEPDYPL